MINILIFNMPKYNILKYKYVFSNRYIVKNVYYSELQINVLYVIYKNKNTISMHLKLVLLFQY
jgi:hypothetical protein